MSWTCRASPDFHGGDYYAHDARPTRGLRVARMVYVIELKRQNPVLHRRKFFQGQSLRGLGMKDIAWYEPSGKEMTDEAWNAPHLRCLGVRLAGAMTDERRLRTMIFVMPLLFFSSMPLLSILSSILVILTFEKPVSFIMSL